MTFINLLFGAFELAVLFGWTGRWMVALDYTSALMSIDPDFYRVPSVAVLVLLGSVMFITIIGSLKFMWDIRHPKN